VGLEGLIVVSGATGPMASGAVRLNVAKHRSTLSRPSFVGTGRSRSTAERSTAVGSTSERNQCASFVSGHVHASYTRPAGDTSQRCPDASLATATISPVSLAVHLAAAMALDRVRYEPEP
jgi:hypothetical protein